MAEQIKDYRGVFEMFDEEGNGQVKTGELVWLMGLLGINPTKSELASMAKDVDRDSEAGRGSPGQGRGGAVPPSPRPCCLLPAEKGFFSYDSFLALMGVSREKAQNQEHELRVAFRVFDKEGKGCILHRLGHAQVGPGRRGGSGAGAPPAATQRGAAAGPCS